MDLLNPESMTIKKASGSQEEAAGRINVETVPFKTEPVPREDEWGIPHTETDVDLLDVKNECLKHSESITPTADIIFDGNNIENVPFKAETVPREDGWRIPYTETDVDPLDDKNEPLMHSESITPTADFTTDLKTQPGKKYFSCPNCSYSCPRMGTLNRHMLTHSGIKPFSCLYCSYSCSRMGTLTRHLLTHSGEKPFSCSDCNYVCSEKRHLKRHMLTHTQEKPYSCSHCSYLCSRKGHLNRHMLTHTGERPYACLECTNSFSEKGTLKRHMLTHTREKPYACSYCHYVCSEHRVLRRHMLTHSAIKPFLCSECNYSSIREISLKNHMRTHGITTHLMPIKPKLLVYELLSQLSPTVPPMPAVVPVVPIPSKIEEGVDNSLP